jgi:hypothetical protein
VPIVLRAIIENSGLNNREQIVAQMDQMSQPNPEAQQAQQMVQQLQMQNAQLQNAKLESEVLLNQTKAQAEAVDTQLKPAELQASLAASASKYLSDSNNPTAEFERRIKVANLALKEKDIDTKKEIANLQVVAARQK